MCVLQLQKQRQNVALMQAVLSSSVNIDAIDYVSEHRCYWIVFISLRLILCSVGPKTFVRLSRNFDS